MAEPILKLTRGVPKTDREWMDVFRNLTKFLRVRGDELVIGGDIVLPDQSVGTAEIEDLAVTDVKLRQSQACSVIGRSLNSPGAPTDIQATVNRHFLRRLSDVVSFGAIEDDDIPGTIARDSDVSDAIAAHEAASDPHPGYLTQAEGDSRYPQASSGSFTISLTGCATVPTVTAQYVKNGSMVVLSIPTVTGTSNTTAATLTGLPAAITPVTSQTIIGRAVDNGVNNVARHVINTDGTITLTASVAGGVFTNVGTKGFGDQVFSYLLT